jgi:hypothetical protein
MPRGFIAVVPLLLAVLALVPGRAAAGPPQRPSGQLVLDPEEQRYAFTMYNRPWRDVIDWFAELTGLAFSSAAKLAGTCRFKPLPGKQYTVPEIVDIINGELLTSCNFTLVRGLHAFRFVPLDDPLEFRGMCRDVSAADLYRFGKTEFVRVKVTLTGKDADDLAARLVKLLGTSVVVIPIKQLDEVHLFGTAGEIRTAVRALNRMKSSP